MKNRFAHTLVAALLIAVASSASRLAADTGPGLLLKPWTGEQLFETQTDVRFFDDAEPETKGGDAQLTIVESDGRWRSAAEDGAPAVGYDVLYVDIDSADPALPERLSDQSIAVGFAIGEWDAWKIRGVAGIGYAGTNPFTDGDALYGKASLIFSRQLDEKSQLDLLLNYHGNRSIFPDVPLPGILYTRRVDDTLTYSVGFPVNSIRWQPTERCGLSVRFIPVFSLDALAWYDVTEQLTVFASFRNLYRGFMINQVRPEHDRVFFQQRRLEAGLKWQPAEGVYLLAGAGYAFSQEFSTGFDVRDTNNEIELSDEPYVRMSLKLRF